MLDRGCPAALLGAFPAGVSIERVGLAEAVLEVRGFLAAAEDQPGFYRCFLRVGKRPMPMASGF